MGSGLLSRSQAKRSELAPAARREESEAWGTLGRKHLTPDLADRGLMTRAPEGSPEFTNLGLNPSKASVRIHCYNRCEVRDLIVLRV